MRNPLGGLFRRKESGASRLVVLGLNMPGPIKHEKFDVLAKESYERCIAVYACVSVIMNAAATVDWVQYERRAGGKSFGRPTRKMTKDTAARAFLKSAEGRTPRARKALSLTEVEDTKLLRLIERPNPRQTKSDYVASLAGHMLLAGNAYEEFIKPNREGAAPLEMYPLRPDRVEVVPGDGVNQLIAGYKYTINNKSDDFKPENVIHHKTFHPTNDWYGLSPIQAAMRVIRTDNIASDWNFALLKNQARPSGALMAPGQVSDETYERLKSEIVEGFAGNPGLPLFLEGGLKWEQFGLSPVDIDWLDSKKMNRVEICSIYSVPPEIAGDAEHKTYNSMPEARKAFWMEAVLPFLDALRDAWNMRLAPLYGDGIFLDYDRDQIDALQEDQKILFDRARIADHLSINEVRNMTGYDDDDDPMSGVPRRLLQGAQQAAMMSAAGDLATSPSTSLNGAQVASLLQILTLVAQGQLPRESAVATIMASFNLDEPTADHLLGAIGEGFEPKPMEPPPPAPGSAAGQQQIAKALVLALRKARLLTGSQRAAENALLKALRGQFKGQLEGLGDEIG